MKVLWVHTFGPHTNASGIFMHRMAEHMAKYDIEITLLYVEWQQVFKNLKGYLRSLKRHAMGFDIIHAQYGSGCGYLVSLLEGRKILTLRGTDWYGVSNGSLHTNISSKIKRKLTISSLDKFDKIIVMSNRMAKEIYKKTKIISIILPSGIDLDLFKPLNLIDARKFINSDDDGILVGYTTVNAKNPIKRGWLAEAAIEILKNKIPNIKLIKLSGISPEMMPYYINACNVMLLTSTHEGWPNCIKESLACNVPFVSTDVSDLMEIAYKEQVCRVCSDKPSEISDNILYVLKNYKGEDLRQYVRPMEMGHQCNILCEIYHKLVD